jgi:Protein of unknown function (DUF998)
MRETIVPTPTQFAPSVSSDLKTRPSKILLLCGVVAGPLYVVTGVFQVLTRTGFDPTRHALSLMSNGDLGWIQIANFLVTGLLVIACSVGMRQVLHPGRGGTWGPLLLGLYGLGLIGAGIFVADPTLGFPPGTPEGPPAMITRHGMLHFVSGGVGFLGLIGACFAFARRFAALRQRGWAVYSIATGLIFFGTFFGIASGSKKSWVILAFTAAVVLSWSWLSLVSARLMTEQGRRDVKEQP